jgi:PAS domain S-box-containing protein
MAPSSVQALTDFVAAGTKGSLALMELVDALPVTIYSTDADGRLTYFNRAAVKLSGHVPQLGTDSWCITWKIFLADGTPLPHDQCPMALALKGEAAPAGIECMAERPDGSRFWFTPCPAVIRDDEGRITGGINVLVDVTDRRVAEMQAHANFSTIVDSVPDCVKIVAADGTLLLMNPSGLSMVGAPSAAAVIGKSVYDLIAPEDRDRFREFNERICRGDKGTLEFDIVGLKGTRRHMETRATALSHFNGATVHLALTRDTTASRHAERAGLLLAAVVDSSDDAIISKDLNGIITSWNRGAESIFGYTAAETVGLSITILIPADRLDEEKEILTRLRRGEKVDHFETVRRRKDGTLLDISLTVSPVKDRSGKIIGASKIARDITERKRIEEQRLELAAKERALAAEKSLRETEAELARVVRALSVGELATSIAHEVNQPLAAVVTNAEAGVRWLSGESPNLAEARESLALIARDGSRASSVIRRIREFLKKESTSAALLDIKDVVQETLSLAQAELIRRQVSVRTELSSELPLLRGDRIQLQQVILNLLMNGAEAMASTEGQKDLVVMSRKVADGHVLIAVRDRGTGVEPENIHKLFDAFFSTKAAGMGMGLSISRSIIEAHGGRIWAELNDGPGLTVQFSLPGHSEGEE